MQSIIQVKLTRKLFVVKLLAKIEFDIAVDILNDAKIKLVGSHRDWNLLTDYIFVDTRDRTYQLCSFLSARRYTNYTLLEFSKLKLCE